MKVENEHLIRRTNLETFGRRAAVGLERLGTKGLIPIEMQLEDLIKIAFGHGLEVLPVLSNSDGVGNFVINDELVLTVIPTKQGQSVWIFDNDMDCFKETFIGSVAQREGAEG